MSVKLQTTPDQLMRLRRDVESACGIRQVSWSIHTVEALLADVQAAHDLHALVNNPHTEIFLDATRLEAAHQRDRFGMPHARNKSGENWFWLVGYLAGKCLRAVIEGDKEKAKHHTISSAAALANWFEAIDQDETGCGLGADADIKPIELARFEGNESIETSESEARTPTGAPL
jgi:hypothetical protein